MKFLIVGLGNFGASLAKALTERGHEVFAIDNNQSKVELYKEDITHTICLDATDIVSLKTLPYQQFDVVIIAIGEDFGASLLATALFKQLGVKRIISRAISDVHRQILEAIQIDEIITPEKEAAERLALSLDMEGIHDALQLSQEYTIVEVKAPEKCIGKTIQEIGFRRRYNINVITIRRWSEEKGILNIPKKKPIILGVVGPNTVIEQGDELILFGRHKDIEAFMHQ